MDKAEAGWKQYVGFVPANVLDKKPKPGNTIATTCGPPIMIKFVIQQAPAGSRTSPDYQP